MDIDEIAGRRPPALAGDGRGFGRDGEVVGCRLWDAGNGNGRGGVVSWRRPGALLSRMGFRA